MATREHNSVGLIEHHIFFDSFSDALYEFIDAAQTANRLFGTLEKLNPLTKKAEFDKAYKEYATAAHEKARLERIVGAMVIEPGLAVDLVMRALISRATKDDIDMLIMLAGPEADEMMAAWQKEEEGSEQQS